MRINRKSRIDPRKLGRNLSEAQREVLLFGAVIIAGEGPGFENEAAMRHAWATFRKPLMDAWDTPGQRPNAYFRFDLGERPRGWWEEVAILEARGLMLKDEELQLEKLRVILDGDQAECLFQPEFFHITLKPYMKNAYFVRKFRGEFLLAQGWHARRGRPALSAKYARLMELIDASQRGLE